MSDARSLQAEQWQKLYWTARWKRLRSRQLSAKPLCTMCQAAGKLTPATVADHIKDHKGDVALFFDPANLQSLCATHHNSTKQRIEGGRKLSAIGADGWPIA
jgi:5-methylcytosine-specific restriction protein A